MIYRLVTGHRRTAANVEREVHVVELDVAATRLATDLVLGVAGVGHRRDIQALTRVVARLGDRERLRDIVAARFLLERRNGLRAVTAEDISGVVVSGVVLALGTCLVGSGNVILVGTVLVVIALVAIESIQEIIGYAALVAFVGSVAFVVFAVVVVDNFVVTVFATVVVEGIAVTGGVVLFVLARVCTFVCTLLHRRLHPRRCLGHSLVFADFAPVATAEQTQDVVDYATLVGLQTVVCLTQGRSDDQQDKCQHPRPRFPVALGRSTIPAVNFSEARSTTPIGGQSNGQAIHYRMGIRGLGSGGLLPTRDLIDWRSDITRFGARPRPRPLVLGLQAPTQGPRQSGASNEDACRPRRDA
jgi:hypothetical protein